MTACQQIGRNNALDALDQAPALGLQEAVASYFENLGDTLAEMGVKDGTKQVRDAFEAFEAVLIANNVSFRPHGL